MKFTEMLTPAISPKDEVNTEYKRWRENYFDRTLFK